MTTSKRLAGLAAAVLMAGGSQAATVDLDVTLDLTTTQSVAGPGFQGWQDAPAFAPPYLVELAEGDTFDFTIDFLGSQTLSLTNASFLWAYSYAVSDDTDVTGTGTLSLLDASGNAFLTSAVKTGTEGDIHFGQQYDAADFAGGLLGTITFYGLRYQGIVDDYVEDGITTRSYDDAAFYLNADDVVVGNAVPEPASWAMMIAGFGLAGAAARRRAKGAVLA